MMPSGFRRFGHLNLINQLHQLASAASVTFLKIGWWNSNVQTSWNSRKFSILLPLRGIYFRSYHYETPCSFLDNAICIKYQYFKNLLIMRAFNTQIPHYERCLKLYLMCWLLFFKGPKIFLILIFSGPVRMFSFCPSKNNDK